MSPSTPVFPDEVASREILAVPAVYLNGRLFAQGRMELGDILARLDTGAGEARSRSAFEARSF